MRKKTVLVIVLSLITMLTLTSGILPKALAKEKVVIGWSHPLTGPLAGTAAVHHLYYKMLIRDYNAKGGLNVPPYGLLPIEWIELDDEYNPAKSRANYEALIAAGVDLLFAPWSTAFNVALLDLFTANQYPVVGLTVGSNSLSAALQADPAPWFWVTLGQPWEDAIEFGALVSYINTKVADADKIAKVGITFRDDEHGVEHAEAIRDGLTAMGIEVPVFEPYTWYSPPTDWTTIIGKFRDPPTGPVDVAMLCGYDEGAAFVRACINQNYNPKMVVHGPALEVPFLVYIVFGFTRGEFAGLTYYNGFPTTAYTTPELRAWRDYHVAYTGMYSFMPYLPFPASAVFYAGIESLFKAVETYGLDRPRIRQALQEDTFTTLVGSFKFRKGQSPIVANHGTLTQWQGGNMMDVIWPPCANSSDYIIYPKFPWNYPTHLDINKDRKVDIWDIARACKAFGSYPGHPRWYEKADINEDDKVDILDIATIAKAFGATAAFGGTIPAPPCP